MDAQLAAQAEALRKTAERLARAGLVIERGCLSPEHRRAANVLQCTLATAPQQQEDSPHGLIGFYYPNAR